MRPRSIYVLASALLAAAQAQSGSFSVLTYNVAGLPEPLSGSKPKENTPEISKRVGKYSIVNVQEDFNYHDLLYANDPHKYRTSTSGPVPLGSGLNMMSDFPFHDLQRITWRACWFGSGDCLTPKGFTAVRVEISPGVSVDVYNLHAEAGDDDLDFAARTVGFEQLSKFIKEFSGTSNAIILFGDTNCRYTSAKDPIRILPKDNGLTDVWVQLEKGGTPPNSGTSSIECPFPVAAGKEDNKCEQIDKVFYRSSPVIKLVPTKFINENAKFLRSDGGPLSDHFPVSVPFEWQLAGALRMAPTMVGGAQNTYFSDLDAYKGSFGDSSAKATIKSIALRAGSRLDQISYTMTDGRQAAHGGNGGAATGVVSLDNGEGAREIEVCSGQRVDGQTGIFSIKITTTKGKVQQGGKATSTCTKWVPPEKEGWSIVGFQGRNGAEVDALRVVWGKL